MSANDVLSEVQRLLGFGISQIDLKTGATTWSDEMYRIYGWEPGEVTPSLETMLQRVYPADVDRVRSTFEREFVELRIVRPDGQLRTLHLRSRVVGDRLLGTTIDVTDHKETAARLVFADRMASVGALASGVAHEINNPLAFISAHLELVARDHGDALPGDVVTLLAEARVGVDRITHVVRGLQAFSSTDERQRAQLEVERVLELAVSMAGNQIRHRASLVRTYEPLPAVVANQASLGQVFLNLLINAAEAIPEGETDRHEVRISTRTDDAGWAIIEIGDTGRGIAREIQSQVFDPFFTTKPVGQGTGLGLSICHGIVRTLGGELGFTSTPGAGTVFRVALPPSLALAKAEPPAVAPVPETARRRARVLIIDDEVIFANALRRLLSRDRHEMIIVHDGKEAIARAQAGERFDAIVCDLMMPAVSGMEIHTQLAACAPDLAARMIFLTGGAFSPAAKQFLERVPNVWFEKPCDLETLRAAIGRVAAA